MVYLFHKKDLSRIHDYDELPWTRIGCTVQDGGGPVGVRESKKFSIADQIQRTAAELRQNFVDYVGQLAEQQPDKVLWYASCLASKSVSQTDIFHQYVYLKVLERIGREKDERIVITDNDVFYHHVCRLAPENVQVLSAYRNDNPIPSSGWAGMRKLLKYVVLWGRLRLLRGTKDLQADCLLHMWIDERIFQNRPDQFDPYFGDLASILEQQGLLVLRVAPLSVKLSQINKLIKHVPDVILPLRCVEFRMLWRCLWTRYKISLHPENLKEIRDLKMLVHLTRHEINKERRTRTYCDYLLYYYAYKAMMTQVHAGTAFMYPYENQPWEKMLNLACTGCRRIGYQHSTIPVNWLDYYTSEYEVSEPRPDIVLTSGRRWTEFLETSNKRLQVKEAGTFRYNYLLDKKEERRTKRTPPNILVALPIDPSAALQLQEQIVRLLDQLSYGQYHFLIKPHPYLAQRFVRIQRFNGYANCEVISKPVQEILSESRLCISVDSTVALEAVFSGVPTINYIPEDITQGIEQLIKDHSYIATESDFESVFDTAIKSAESPRVSIEDFFSPVQYQLFYDQVKSNRDPLQVGAS